MLVSSEYPFCLKDLCIRFVCQELSAPKIQILQVPPSGISVSEANTVLVSTGSAVDHRFAWLPKDSLKHSLRELVIFKKKKTPLGPD